MKPCLLPVLRQKGLTLIELMVTLTVIAVMASMAAPSFRTFAANQSLNSVVSEMRTSFETARTTALSRNRQVTVAPISGNNWMTGWQVFVDSNKNGSLDAGEEVVQQHAVTDKNLSTFASEVNDCKPNADVKFSYAADGFLLSEHMGGIAVEHANTERKKRVAINRLGRARVCEIKGGECK